MKSIRGTRFVLWLIVPVSILACLFVTARWFPFADQRAESAAQALFLEATKKLGKSPSEFKGPLRSSDNEGLSLQFCWEMIKPDGEKLCAIYLRPSAEINIYIVRQNPLRYERLSV